MVKFQAMNKNFALFLVLVACHDIFLTHGREIKPLNQHSPPNKSNAVLAGSTQPLKGSFNNNVDTPSSEKRHDSAVRTKNGVATLRISGAGATYTNGFQPTTPGNSPGVGHKKFAQEDKDMKAKVGHSPDVKLHVSEGTTNGYKPTNPGHSPGVGHSQKN